MQISAGSNAYFELVCFNDCTCNYMYLTLNMYMYIELSIDLRKRFKLRNHFMYTSL